MAWRTPGGLTSIRVGLGLAGVVLAAAVLLVRSNQGVYAQPAAPISIAEQAISLDASNTMITAAIARAREMGGAVSVVVVDGHGLQKAMVRMDGALVASVNVAHAKAHTAAIRRMTTEAYGLTVAENERLLHSIPGVQPHTFLTPGGLPIVVDGQVIGAIGAGGGSGPQDLAVATGALAAVQQ
jgi:uncharacterized protein GlcG (DUF336 family)